MDIVEQKKILRRAAAQRRGALAAEARRAAAAAFADAAPRVSELVPGPVISGYHRFGAEADCFALLSALAGLRHITALPVVTAPRRPLSFRRWNVGDAVVPGRWDIPVPVAEAEGVVPDGLLVPLLAFDRAGFRLGYGGGFYDRTLTSLRETRQITAIGLAFATQEVDRVPRAAYDARLDWILTDSELIDVRGDVAHSFHR